MTHYMVVTLTPTDDAWIPGYLASVGDLVAKHGGRYVTRTASFERLEGRGDLPAMVVVLEWPSEAAARSFYDDPDYRPHRDARMAGSSSEFYLVAAKDDFA